MNTTYIATTVAAAFWSGQFAPVDALWADCLGFQIRPSDFALCAHAGDYSWTAILLIGGDHILAVTGDGTALEVDFRGNLLGERRHRVVTAVSPDGFTVNLAEDAA